MSVPEFNAAESLISISTTGFGVDKFITPSGAVTGAATAPYPMAGTGPFGPGGVVPPR